MPTNPVKKFFSVSEKDAAKDYKKKKGKQSESVYKKVIHMFFIEIFKKMIHENFIFMLPYSGGTVSIRSFKPKISDIKKGRKYINWQKTKEAGKKIYYLNKHSNGQLYYFKWDKSFVKFRNRKFYKFKATRSKCATVEGIGTTGLHNYIMEVSSDPTKKNSIIL